jgi:hypothetical protein
MPATFPYRIGRWSRYLLLAWGVRAGHREVVIDDDRLLTRFGWVTAQVPLADIERWEITGPYHWFRAIGTRHTLFSQDISFCGDASGAVRVWLRTPRRISFVRSVNLVYLGVEDLAGLGAFLAAHGITGEDLRTPA